MGASRKEVEIKLPFPSPEEAVQRLESLGARLIQPREFEDNRVFDSRAGALRRTGRLLRVRRFGSRATITFKCDVPGLHEHKVREERETSLDDAGTMESILEGLEFVPVYRYEKFRRSYLLDDVEVSVDETPIGCYVELEGEPEAIDRVARRLGFERKDYIRGTYRDLHEARAGEEGRPAGDLLFSRDDP